MFIDLQRVNGIIRGASKVETRARLPVGSKTSEAGRASPIYATFKVAGAPLTFAETCEALRKMGRAAVNVTLPRIVSGDCELEIQLRPVYEAQTFAAVLEAFDAAAREKREDRERRATGNIPIPAPAPDAPTEKSAKERAKGAKGAAPANGAPATL